MKEYNNNNSTIIFWLIVFMAFLISPFLGIALLAGVSYWLYKAIFKAS